MGPTRADPGGERIRVVRGDISRVDVEAVVNAANTALIAGGGVDGAIHRAAGPELEAACRALPEVAPGVRCPTGEVRATAGFGLRARLVLHAVAPVWRGGAHGEVDLLRACYANAMALAAREGVRSIAFPALGCGAFGTPIGVGTRIAVEEIARAFREPTSLIFAWVVAFEGDAERGYRRALERLRG